MKVYIELFVIDNIMTSASAAWLAYSFFGMRADLWRIAAAVALGTVAGAAYPFVRLPVYFTVLAKLLLGALISEILFGGMKKTIVALPVFFASTALIGGACVAVSYMSSGSLMSASGSPSLPYLVPSVISVITVLVSRPLIGAARKKRAELRMKCEAEITVMGVTARLRGFIDSGNGLTDGGIPVAVIKMSSFTAVFGTDALLASKARKRANALGGSGEILILVKPQSFRLYYGEKENTYKDVMLGVSALGFDREEDLLLPSSVLGG